VLIGKFLHYKVFFIFVGFLLVDIKQQSSNDL